MNSVKTMIFNRIITVVYFLLITGIYSERMLMKENLRNLIANEDISADNCMRKFLMLKTDLNDITTNPTKRNPVPQDYMKST
ncbi:Apple domain containing protein [Cryptosporidium meleagridis]